MAVKVAIVLARSECSILFWDEEEWGSLWGFGGHDASGLKMFFDESLTGFLLSRVCYAGCVIKSLAAHTQV